MVDIIGSIHSASRWFEDWAGRHEHDISLLEAISTTAAVIVALWSAQVARSASRPKLKARVSVLQIFGDGTDLKAVPTYLALRLTNIGNVPIRVNSTCFSWRLPSSKTSWAALPLDGNGDMHVARRQYPIVLLPNTSDTIFLSSIERFREALPRILASAKLSSAQGAKKLRGYVYTDDGSLFRAILDGTVGSEIDPVGAPGSTPPL